MLTMSQSSAWISVSSWQRTLHCLLSAMGPILYTGKTRPSRPHPVRLIPSDSRQWTWIRMMWNPRDGRCGWTCQQNQRGPLRVLGSTSSRAACWIFPGRMRHASQRRSHPGCRLHGCQTLRCQRTTFWVDPHKSKPSSWSKDFMDLLDCREVL